MSEQELNALIAETKNFIKGADSSLKEDEEMKKAIDFALNEYKTNKRWFREEPGRVTFEDIIRMSVIFGWNMKRQYDYENKK